MSFRIVREDCAGINKSMDSIESKLKDIEVAFLRAKVAELENKMEGMIALNPIEISATFDGGLDGELAAGVALQ